MKKISLVLSLIFCLGVYANDEIGSDKEHAKPCKEDREKFCKDVKPGEGRIIKCLKEHEEELSATCKSFRESRRNAAKENHGKCKADRKKFCKGVKPGDGRIINCLKEHSEELSADCKTVIDNKKK